MAHNKKLKDYWGDLPRHSKGMNKSRMDREAIANLYGFSIEAIFKAYCNWQDIFRIEGSDLTFKQYLDKLSKSNLHPSNIGNEDWQYNLSRYNDKGVYTDSNCRFITRLENLAEQEH